MACVDNGHLSHSNCADIDDCISTPCQHDGICTDLENGYKCSCAAGYTGGECETGKICITCNTFTLMCAYMNVQSINYKRGIGGYSSNLDLSDDVCLRI